MNREEFLKQLKEALQDNLSSSAVQENMNYYNEYILEEVSKGKSEVDVLRMLGDPWVLARTLIDAADGTDRQNVYESEGHIFTAAGQTADSGQKDSSVRGFYRIDTWWKKLLLVLTIVMVVVLIVAVIAGVVRLLMPIVIPVLIVMIIIRAIGERRS